MATAIIALCFGLAISGAIYFIFFWPAIEPEDGEEEAVDGEDEVSKS
jgi:hypothetical protein